MTTLAASDVQRLMRRDVERWLPDLDAWLLHGQFYGVQHTWPQLYRSDGDGMFFAIAGVGKGGERDLLSHCACRVETLVAGERRLRAGLLGSVATAPSARGQGLAGRVLGAALQALAPLADVVLLWAERPELYARAGFTDGAVERCALLARRPRRDVGRVRVATIADYAAMHALHERKPVRITRTVRTMSTLLSTPGMTTAVLERDGQVVAYACCGKGADLQGHWHELGGDDDAVADLLPAALHLAEQVEAIVIVPPYRDRLVARLGAGIVGEGTVPGPMLRVLGGAAMATLPPVWVDGLDSV